MHCRSARLVNRLILCAFIYSARVKRTRPQPVFNSAHSHPPLMNFYSEWFSLQKTFLPGLAGEHFYIPCVKLYRNGRSSMEMAGQNAGIAAFCPVWIFSMSADVGIDGYGQRTLKPDGCNGRSVRVVLSKPVARFCSRQMCAACIFCQNCV